MGHIGIGSNLTPCLISSCNDLWAFEALVFISIEKFCPFNINLTTNISSVKAELLIMKLKTDNGTLVT